VAGMGSRFRYDRTSKIVLTAIPFAAILVLLAPYLWPPDHAPTSYFSDIHHQHGPNLKLLADALKTDGELPRWNVQDFAGTSTLGDPQVGLYNPVYWLLLLNPTLHSLGLMIVGYTLIGAFGFILYGRAVGLSLAAAAGGAVAFTIGGKLLLHLVLPGHSVKAPFYLVPLILWAIDRTANRPSPGRVVATSGLTALLVVSLHPQILFYTMWVLLIAGVAAARRAPRPGRAFGALALAMTLTLALAAVHVLPFIALAGEFSRAHPELYDVLRWDAENPGASAHWLEVVTGASESWEGHYYFGGVTLYLVFLGLYAWPRGDPRRSLVWLHGSLALVLLLYGLGREGGLQPLLARIPGFGHFRIPARALVVLGLPVALLAALGIEACMSAPVRRRRFVAVGAAPAAATLLAVAGATTQQLTTLAVAVGGAVLLDKMSHSEPAAGDNPLPATPVSVSLPPACLAGAALLIAALAVDAGSAIKPWVATVPEREIGHLATGVNLPDDLPDAFRIAEIGRDTTNPGIPELARRRYRLNTLSGYNSLIPWRFILYACYASGYSPFTYNVGDAVPIFHKREKLFELLGVTHLLYQPGEGTEEWQWERSASAFPGAYLVPGPIIVPEGRGKNLMGLEMHSLELLEDIDPRQQVLLHGDMAESALEAIGARPAVPLEPFRPIPLTARSANRIALELRTERPGIVVVNEPFFRGWRAWDAGTEIPILRANVLFRAVALPPGRHEIVLEFSPLSWRLGWWITVSALLATVGLGISGVRARNKGWLLADEAHDHPR
jgi:hypothetical protein